MKKIVAMFGIAVMTILLAACPAEKAARDTAAALQGSLLAAQAKYQTSCQANANQNVCQLINKGISAQNALITSTELYCGWAATNPPPDPSTKCVPVKSAQAVLESALANARTLTIQIKGAI